MMLRVAWQMALANLWALLRDRKALVMLIGLPVALMAILDFSLSGVFGGKGLPAFDVVVVNQDQQPVAHQLVKVLESQNDLIHVKTVSTVTAARAAVDKNDAVVDVWIHDGFSQQVSKGNSGLVTVEAKPGHSTDMDIVQMIVNSFGEQMGVAKALPPGLAGATFELAEPAVHFNEQSSDLHPITSGAYYAIGMMVMFMLTHAIRNAEVMVREKNTDRYKRILAAPSSRFALAGGHFLSTFLVLLLQGFILLLCSRLLLGIQLGPANQTVPVVVAYAIALSGITTLIGASMTNVRAVGGIGNIGAQVASVLGGSIFPIYGFPKVLQYVAHVLPNGRAVSSLLNSISGIATSQLIVPMCYLLCLGICLGLLASLRYGQPAR